MHNGGVGRYRRTDRSHDGSQILCLIHGIWMATRSYSYEYLVDLSYWLWRSSCCSILIFRLHAFLTLLLAGLLVAALTGDKAVTQYTNLEVANGKMTSLGGWTSFNLEPSALISAPSRLATGVWSNSRENWHSDRVGQHHRAVPSGIKGSLGDC